MRRLSAELSCPLADVLAALLPAASEASTTTEWQPEEAVLLARLQEFGQPGSAHNIAKRFEMATPTVTARNTYNRSWIRT